MSNQSARRGNLISRYVDPIRNAASMEGHVLMAETVAKLVAVIITSLGFFIWGKDVAAQYTDIVALHWLTGILFVAIAAWITDFAFSHFLENSMFQFLAFWKFDWIHTAVARDGWYITFLLRPMRWAVVTVIVAGLFWADWTSVYTLRSPIANAKAERAKRVDFSALRAEQQRAISATVAPIDSEIKQTRADIASAERAVAANNPALQQLAAEGNSWAKGQIASKKAKETKPLKKRLAALQAQRDAAYSGIVASTAQERSIAIADDQAAQTSDGESKTAISTLFTQFGIGSKILTILFRLFLIINFLINTPNWDANRDGVVDGDDVTAAASGRSAHTTTPPHPQGFPAGGHSPAFAGRRRAGFVRHDDPPESRTEFGLGAPAVPPTTPTSVPAQNPVEHCSTGETPEQSTGNNSGTEAPGQSVPKGVLIDVKYWKMQAKQCLERSMTQKSEKSREDNRIRYEVFRTMLEALGFQVERTGGWELNFREPEVTDTSDDAMRIIEAQHTILWNLKNRQA